MLTTKQQLIGSASRLIRKKGYYGTGINEVLSEVAVPKGSLYHHFPGGKDELIIAALDQTALDRAELFKHAMKGKGSAAAGLKAVVDIFIREVETNEPLYGCPVATVSLDVSDDNDAIREACVRLFDFWIEAIRSYLEYKGVEDAERKALSFFTRLEGALLLSKARKSTEPLEFIKQEMNQLFN